MALTKLVSPLGWDFDCPVAALLKVGRDGRVGPNDRRDLVKRAGAQAAHVFADAATKLAFPRDVQPVHLIALGAKEAYGPNRNGDGFSEATLRAAHPTFVKYAYWFRNHKNKKHEGHPHYGAVKLSAYNDVMRRVELLCALPTTKAAADLMGCDGPADREMEKLAGGSDIPVSMACRVPYDVCSFCQNRARTREEYCKEASCAAGGCDQNLTRLVKMGGDFHHLHVDNPHPTFFDISNVWRPADRIAYAGKADWLTKAASAGWDGTYDADRVKAAAAFGVTAPLAAAADQDAAAARTPAVAAAVKLAYGLAALDSQPDRWANREVARAFSGRAPLDIARLGLDASPEKAAAVLAAMADMSVIVPLADFAAMTKRAADAAAAAARLRGVYARMIDDGTLEPRLAACRYSPAEKAASARAREAAARVYRSHSLARPAVDSRCLASAARGLPAPAVKTGFYEKAAARAAEAEDLAREYACYQAAALRRISEFDDQFLLTASGALCQNHVN